MNDSVLPSLTPALEPPTIHHASAGVVQLCCSNRFTPLNYPFRGLLNSRTLDTDFKRIARWDLSDAQYF